MDAGTGPDKTISQVWALRLHIYKLFSYDFNSAFYVFKETAA
jgi:hypothetical protein